MLQAASQSMRRKRTSENRFPREMRDGEARVDRMTNHSSIYGPHTVCTNERQYTRGISFVPPIVHLTWIWSATPLFQQHGAMDRLSLAIFLSAGITGLLPGTTRVIFKRHSKDCKVVLVRSVRYAVTIAERTAPVESVLGCLNKHTRERKILTG